MNTNKNGMHSIKLLLATAMLFALMPSPFSFATQSVAKKAFPVPGDYAVEYSDPWGGTHYWNLIAPSRDIGNALAVKPIANWQMPIGQTITPHVIMVTGRREGDIVNIELNLIYLPIEEASGKVVKYRSSYEGLPTQLIGTYSLGLGESVDIQRLVDFGVEPFRLKVVPAKARALDLNQIENRTKAIQVLRIDKARSTYLLALKNLSSQKTTVAKMS